MVEDFLLSDPFAYTYTERERRLVTLVHHSSTDKGRNVKKENSQLILKIYACDWGYCSFFFSLKFMKKLYVLSNARLAQSVESKALDLVAVGWSPTVGFL